MKVSVTSIGDALREAFPEDGSVPDEVRVRHHAYRERVQRARLKVLAAILDLATTERDDSLTEIGIRSDELGAPLRPTNDEWIAAEELAAVFREAYPRGLEAGTLAEPCPSDPPAT